MATAEPGFEKRPAHILGLDQAGAGGAASAVFTSAVPFTSSGAVWGSACTSPGVAAGFVSAELASAPDGALASLGLALGKAGTTGTAGTVDRATGFPGLAGAAGAAAAADGLGGGTELGAVEDIDVASLDDWSCVEVVSDRGGRVPVLFSGFGAASRTCCLTSTGA